MGKRLDITNQTFNHLTAIEATAQRGKNGAVLWRFRCSCGNDNVIKPATDVIRGNIIRCEQCCRPNCFGGNRYKRPVTVRPIGDRSGCLTIVDVDLGDGSAQDITYICKCDCGTEPVTISHKRFLIKSQLHSCGCQRKEIAKQNTKNSIKILDITNERKGKLVAQKCLDPVMKATARWEFLCDCGNKHIMQANDFIRNRANSCGCIQSLSEMRIEQWLRQQDIVHEQQVSFQDLVGLNGGPLRFDFGIYDQNNNLICLLEYDGYYHFHDTSLTYKGTSVHYYTKEHDVRKNQYCKDHNIQLIRLNDEDSIEDDLDKLIRPLCI